MSKIKTVDPKGDFWMVHCTDYDIQFTSVEVTVAGKSGDILEDAATKVGADSAEVLGILAEDTDGTGFVRVMVRGNPSQVNGKELNYNGATEATVNDLLAEKGIVVTNNW